MRQASWKNLLLSLAIVAIASPAIAAGKYVRFGNTEIITGPTKYTKSVVITSETADVDNDGFSYGGVAYLPAKTKKKFLALKDITYLGCTYTVLNGVTGGGAPRFSIILDVNHDGNFTLADDEVVFVSLGESPDFQDAAGATILTGNVIDEDDRFTSGFTGVPTNGSLDDIKASSVNGFSVGNAEVINILLIVDGRTDADALDVAVSEMRVNKDKLNPKAKLPVVD